MKNFHCSIRVSLGFIIALTGLLGLILALVTGEIYRDQALENQRTALAELIRLETNNILLELEDTSKHLGLGIQHSTAFHQAFNDRDQQAITNLLNNQFHQYFVTAGVVKLEKLYVFDEFFTLIAGSTDGQDAEPSFDIICPNLAKRAKRRHGAQRLQPISELCLYKGRPYHGVIVPSGGLRVNGYISVITDPSHSLKTTETALGMPLRLALPDDSVVYVSDNWPDTAALHNLLVAEHVLQTQLFEPALKVEIVNDIQALNNKLDKTRYYVMLIAGTATVLTIFFALLVLRKTTLLPLRTLTKQLRLLRQDRTHLGEHVSVGGNTEIRELAANFNEMTSELKELYQTLENLAFNDSLTELPNRTLFLDRLEQVTLLFQRNTSHFALFMMDLDRFKKINDTLGHRVGDKLLQQVGARLQDALRKSDTVARLVDQTVARLGGDEFAAILPTIRDEKSALVVAQKIQRVMEPPFLVEGHSLGMGISIGIAVYPIHGKDGQVLLQRADVAMYQAKHNHQGFAIYDSSNDHHSLSQLTLINELRNAIDCDELELHYQPKINMKLGIIDSMEALMRWPHKERGLMLPENFIPLAEQSGLIKPLTLWLLSTAIEQCANWHDQGLDLGVSINLSVRNLSDLSIVDHVMQIIREKEMEPNWLTIELTECAVMGDSNRALEILTLLNKNGVRLSVDDFGTGYSSLAYLKKLPVCEIKIDRTFVLEMKDNHNDGIIVRSTIDLAHNMNLLVTAEGVEDKETWDMLMKLGCDMAQGYFITRALPATELEQWMTESRWQLRVKDEKRERVKH
jgi:diguanylate cyclase (GGDEF)-like protein